MCVTNILLQIQLAKSQKLLMAGRSAHVTINLLHLVVVGSARFKPGVYHMCKSFDDYTQL